MFGAFLFFSFRPLPFVVADQRVSVHLASSLERVWACAYRFGKALFLSSLFLALCHSKCRRSDTGVQFLVDDGGAAAWIRQMSKEVGLAADWGLTDIISGKESQSLMAYSSQGNKIPRNVNSEKSVKTAQVKPAMLTTIRFQVRQHTAWEFRCIYTRPRLAVYRDCLWNGSLNTRVMSAVGDSRR